MAGGREKKERERVREREHEVEVGWVGRWRRSEKIWGKGKNMIKIHCLKRIIIEKNKIVLSVQKL